MKYLIFILISLISLGLKAEIQDDRTGLDISMQYSRKADGTVTLIAEVYDEEEYEAVPEVEFKFYSVANLEEIFLGSAYSDEDALVRLPGIPFGNILRDQSDGMTFRITGESDNFYGSADFSFRHADLKVNFDIIDSKKIMSVMLTGLDENGESEGIEDGEVYFYAPRSWFGEISLGDVWTDDTGYDKIEFPEDLPGNENGIVQVVARITENEELGNLEVLVETDWGVPTALANDEIQRSLWASGASAPISLLILVNSLIICVWGVIIYIIYKIYRLNRV